MDNLINIIKFSGIILFQSIFILFILIIFLRLIDKLFFPKIQLFNWLAGYEYNQITKKEIESTIEETYIEKCEVDIIDRIVALVLVSIIFLCFTLIFCVSLFKM